MIDIDYSFIRLRDNFEDAKNLGESPQATICYNTQIRLAKGETYLQISNSPTSIVFNDEYTVHLIDICGNEVEDITENVFITEFFDSNGIKQIAWEYICDSEYYYKPLSFKFTNTVNDNTWYTNLVNITEDSKELTERFDYKHFENHFGTQYERADYYQSIRLALYYRNPINEDEIGEYHEITTNKTVGQRPIVKRKRRYVLDDSNNWVNDRITYMSYSSSLYVSNVKMTCTTPLEFNEPEMDSNIYETELILNPIWDDVFTFSYQIFEGLEITSVFPFGTYTQATIEAEGKCFFTIVPTLNTGSLTVYDASDDSVVSTFTEGDMSIEDTSLYIPTLDADLLPNGTYYIQFDDGLITALGLTFAGISDKTTWRFTLTDGDYDSSDYSNDYLTN